MVCSEVATRNIELVWFLFSLLIQAYCCLSLEQYNISEFGVLSSSFARLKVDRNTIEIGRASCRERVYVLV